MSQERRRETDVTRDSLSHSMLAIGTYYSRDLCASYHTDIKQKDAADRLLNSSPKFYNLFRITCNIGTGTISQPATAAVYTNNFSERMRMASWMPLTISKIY